MALILGPHLLDHRDYKKFNVIGAKVHLNNMEPTSEQKTNRIYSLQRQRQILKMQKSTRIDAIRKPLL